MMSPGAARPPPPSDATVRHPNEMHSKCD